MSGDPEVMAYLLPLVARRDADGWIDRQRSHLQEHGFCLWAVEAPGLAGFVGSVGLQHVSYTEHFTPAVEIGWRIARPFWGKGFAPEAAGAALRLGFETLGLDQVVATASIANEKSRRVMTKLGMTHDPSDDFDHPRVPDGHRLRRSVLYRLTRARWSSLPPGRRNPIALPADLRNP